jgi:hypothetical protein
MKFRLSYPQLKRKMMRKGLGKEKRTIKQQEKDE